jgi:GntR family transcriptional regulator
MTKNGATELSDADHGPQVRVPQRTGRPLYEQMANDLRTKISDGVYAVGAALPSTAKLMREYGVSITAVRAAVGVLKHEGIVIGQPGKAVYVRRGVEHLASDTVALEARVEQLQELVLNLTRRVVELERGSCSHPHR